MWLWCNYATWSNDNKTSSSTCGYCCILFWRTFACQPAVEPPLYSCWRIAQSITNSTLIIPILCSPTPEWVGGGQTTTLKCRDFLGKQSQTITRRSLMTVVRLDNYSLIPSLVKRANPLSLLVENENRNAKCAKSVSAKILDNDSGLWHWGERTNKHLSNTWMMMTRYIRGSPANTLGAVRINTYLLSVRQKNPNRIKLTSICNKHWSWVPVLQLISHV